MIYVTSTCTIDGQMRASGSQTTTPSPSLAQGPVQVVGGLAQQSLQLQLQPQNIAQTFGSGFEQVISGRIVGSGAKEPS